MKVKVLGASGSQSPQHGTSCYLINDNVLLDAGCCATELDLNQQKSIDHILVTHPHLDHVKDICFVLDNTFDPKRNPLKIHSSGPILNHLKSHLFNDVIWPDFTKICPDPVHSPGQSMLQYVPLSDIHDIEGLKVTHVKVNHTVDAIGYILDDGDSQVVFTGDTGHTDDIWELANQCENLAAVFTEISFPNRESNLAIQAGHYTASQLITELRKLKIRDIPIYIAHFKPAYFEELWQEFHQLADEGIFLLYSGDSFSF